MSQNACKMLIYLGKNRFFEQCWKTSSTSGSENSHRDVYLYGKHYASVRNGGQKATF